MRRVFGSPAARVIGLFDGLLSSKDKSNDELHKFKDRAELAGVDASAWWAEVSGALNGDCDALRSRIADADEMQPRLDREIAAAQVAYDASGKSDAETRLRRLERDLAHLRQERNHLADRLRRAEADREAAYQRARAAALSFLEYYQGLMRAYSAANRKALDKDKIPEIELPQALSDASYDGSRSRPPARAPGSDDTLAADAPQGT